MSRRLALALLLALIPGLAAAQFATIGPTPATSDNGDRLATTAWVNNFVGSSLPLASGKIWIGSVGNLAVAQTPSGDLTVSNAGAFTLATVNSNTGPFGSATQCVTVTTNAKGLTTAVSAATCTPAIGSITGLGTGIAAALAVNVGSAGAPVLFNGALGTPSSGTLTNATGLPTTGLTGALQAAQEPAHTGDVTNSAGSLAMTLAAGNAGNLNSGTLLAARMPAFTGDCTTSAGAVATTCTKINGVDQTSAWSTYTPTPTCNTGAGTWTVNTSKSKQLGKTVFWEIDVTLSAVGTCTGTAWKFNLPSTAVSGAGGAGGETAINGTYVVCVNAAATAVETCTTGAALAVNERFVASGVYEGP